jgi:predicted nucleotidyltransferase
MMTAGANPKKTMAGYRLRQFRDACRAWGEHNGPHRIMTLKSIAPMPMDRAIIIEEMFRRGMADRKTGRLTDSGLQVGAVTIRPRQPKDAAIRVLQKFLNDVDLANQNADCSHWIEEVWLYGSMLGDEEAVGDIDLAVKMQGKWADSKDFYLESQRLQALQDRIGNNRWFLTPMDFGEWFTQRAVFGERKHPLLSVVWDTDQLKAFAVPCRRLYHRESGGIVDEPILLKHPEATSRTAQWDPAERIDLTPREPLRPMSALWLQQHHPDGVISATTIAERVPSPIWPEYLGRKLGVGRVDGEYETGENGLVSVLKFKGLQGASIHINRRLSEGETEPVLEVGFQVENDKPRKPIDRLSLLHVCSLVGALVEADYTRAAMCTKEERGGEARAAIWLTTLPDGVAGDDAALAHLLSVREDVETNLVGISNVETRTIH